MALALLLFYAYRFELGPAHALLPAWLYDGYIRGRARNLRFSFMLAIAALRRLCLHKKIFLIMR